MSMSVRPGRVIITGGRGRLATLVSDYFRAPKHSVELYSRNPSPGFFPLRQLTERRDWQSNDVILHMAWSTLPATSEQHPSSEARCDLPLLSSILDHLASLAPAQRPHFVMFSSGGTVYGNATAQPSRESDLCRPIGNYGRAKVAAEQQVQAATQMHNLSSTILRISNPYGYPVPAARAQGIIPHAIRSAAEGRVLQLWGDGHARKDFLYHTDFLSALEQIVEQRPSGIYNLCAGESHSILEVIDLVGKHTGKKIELEHKPAPAWDVEDSRLDPAKLKATIDWQPQVSLDEGIRRSVAGYFMH